MGRRYVAYALLAAALYALSTPFSKVLLADVAPSMMAALLYLGAGIGMCIVLTARRASGGKGEAPLRHEDARYVVAMVALDVAAPLLLMAGLATAPAENVSLLNNFEIVATAAVAALAFGERVDRRLTLALALITASCAALSLDSVEALRFSPGSVLVLAACVCWGIENNCTAAISERDPLQTVAVKGVGSGTGALAIAFACGNPLPEPFALACAASLGFVAYGLSIFFYIRAQSGIGAARTSAYYAVAPFVGAKLSWAIFRTPPNALFAVGVVLMIAGSALAAPRHAEGCQPS